LPSKSAFAFRPVGVAGIYFTENTSAHKIKLKRENQFESLSCQRKIPKFVPSPASTL
jgi:hypothetical protein